LHGLVSNAEWTGVPLSTLLEETGIDPKATWIIAEGADSLALSRSFPLKKALDDAMVALYQNGERLMPGNGYPMRLVLPGWEGNMLVKFLRRLKLTDQPGMTYFETRTYSQILPNGKAYRFYFVNEVKSFITHPSFGQALKEPGYYEISGIAYSGDGRIAKVLVSADGGKSWAQAALQEPVQSKAFTRFRTPWRWDGQPAILQSRAWDEAGKRAAAARAIRRRARRGREGPQRVRVRQPALQQPHELGDRQQGRDQACLCLRRLLPSCSRSPSLQSRRWPSLRGWENRFRRPKSKHGTSAFFRTARVCRPAAAPPNKAPKSTRRSAWRATAKAARAASVHRWLAGPRSRASMPRRRLLISGAIPRRFSIMYGGQCRG